MQPPSEDDIIYNSLATYSVIATQPASAASAILQFATFTLQHEVSLNDIGTLGIVGPHRYGVV